MQNFEFRKHMVVETNFKDNGGKLYETIKNVTEAYGMPIIDLTTV